MVDSATIAEYALAHSATPNAATTDTQIATCGLLKRGDTRATAAEAGKPPSRANAKSMRELDVIDDKPQNHIAPSTTHRIALPSHSPSAVRRTKMNGLGADT